MWLLAMPSVDLDLHGPSQSDPRPRVQTAEGTVIGQIQDGVASWKGIPYAAPPTGDLRWRAPRAPASRSQVLDAADFGPRCPQDDRGSVRPGEGRTGEEDCLQLNIWAPADADAASRLPVLVWIHGGGMIQGSGTLPLYEGGTLARTESVVVVTINYRLGALGFLAHPALAGDLPGAALGGAPGQPAAGNYGLLDQQAALRWLLANVEGFGGDPERLMIFGESAGGVSVCAQLASPLSAGLFDAAVMQSGNCLGDSIPALDAERGRIPSAYDQGRRFAAAAGCDAASDVAACLRALPVETVLDTLPGEVGLLNADAETYGPIIDGHVLLEPPADALREGRAHPVPFIAGATADEATIFLPQRDMSYAQFAALVRSFYGSMAEEVLALYPESEYPDGRDALAAVTGDTAFVCPARRAVRDHAVHGYPAWLYHFTRVPAYARQSGIGAHHGVEIPYLFGTARSAITDGDRRIGRRMMADWASLGRTGRPADDQQPAWTSVNEDPGAGLRLDDPLALESSWRSERCDLWDRIADAAEGLPTASPTPVRIEPTPSVPAATATVRASPEVTRTATTDPQSNRIQLPILLRSTLLGD